MKISVIIPVYNAEKYVERAVESALMQKECGEVILVEDKSPDNAIEICKKLANKYKNVLLYEHEDGLNKGPGESRNLGVLKSNYDYIAFLDADDIYLPDRFKNATRILSADKNIDGVYEPVLSTFLNDKSKERYFNTHSSEIAMVTKAAAPEQLFEMLISGKYGYIHPNGLVVKKEAFFKVGMFPELRLHEDTVLHFKLSLLSRLTYGERKKPVSERLLHMQNIITKPGNNFIQSRYTSFKYLVDWMEKNKINPRRIRFARIKYLKLRYRLLKQKRRYIMAIIYYIMHKILRKTTRNY